MSLAGLFRVARPTQISAEEREAIERVRIELRDFGIFDIRPDPELFFGIGEKILGPKSVLK